MFTTTGVPEVIPVLGEVERLRTGALAPGTQPELLPLIQVLSVGETYQLPTCVHAGL